MDDYVKSITITTISPCASEPDKVRVRAELPVDVRDLLPYLNAVLPGVVYSPGIPSLTLTVEFRLLTIYKDHIMLDRALSSTDARETIDWVREQMNDVYRRRRAVTPVHKQIKRPDALGLYKLLPGNNCGKSQESTCMAFAVGLAAGKYRSDDCELVMKDSIGLSRLKAALSEGE